MKKILIILLLFSWRTKTSEPDIQDEDIEVSELLNTSDESFEEERISSSRSTSTRPRSAFTPKQMQDTYGTVRSIITETRRSPSTSPTKTSTSGFTTPTNTSYMNFDIKLRTLTPDNLEKLVKHLKKPDYPKFIYPVQHVFKGSAGAGKHYLANLDEANIEDPALPFVRNNKSNQLMGIVYLKKNKDIKKVKFSTILPLDKSSDEIHEKLLSLDLTNPYAKGKIFGKSFQNKSLIMKLDDYFIVIDLDSNKPKSLQDLFIANSVYPLFSLTTITEDDLTKSDKPIDLVNFSILQDNKQWSQNITAQITSSELRDFLQHALSSTENWQRYAIGCSNENIIISIPYNFAENKVNLDFASHTQNIPLNMYRITLEIPKIVAQRIQPESPNYCAIMTSDKK
jgi:hypothetical protein